MCARGAEQFVPGGAAVLRGGGGEYCRPRAAPLKRGQTTWKS